MRYIKKRDIPLHLMLLPGVILVIIFSYVPMAGFIIAFQKFIPARGLFGPQKWVGFDNFRYILMMPNTLSVLQNTVLISILKIVGGILVPIVVSLLVNELKSKFIRRSVQTMIYFPYFLSWVILGGVLIDILSPSKGIVNALLMSIGIDPIFFLGDKDWFRFTIIFSDIWKNFGFGTVVYLAAISGIDPSLYESAKIDGANHWKQTWHITLPGMKMVIILILVLNLGNILNAGFEQIFNLYSPQVYVTGDIIDTLVYRLGLIQAQFGPATAVGLFKSIISFVLISSSYYAAYRYFDYRIF